MAQPLDEWKELEDEVEWISRGFRFQKSIVSPVWQLASVHCKVCGATEDESVDTQNLQGPFVCADHPINSEEFEWEHDGPLAGDSLSPHEAELCYLCEAPLSRYNEQSICGPCIREADLGSLDTLLQLDYLESHERNTNTHKDACIILGREVHLKKDGSFRKDRVK
jgi:hypothetical protein